MTVIAAIQYQNGSMLGTDTRVIIGNIKRDHVFKMEPLTKNIGIASSGLTGACDDIIDIVKNWCKSTTSHVTFDDLKSRLSAAALEWHKENAEKLEEDEDDDETYSFLLVSPERIRKIMRKGYSEESYNYDCDGSGSPYAEYLLGKLYRENLNEEEAKELLVHIIYETSRIDPNVSEEIRLLVFPKGEDYKMISEEEISDIKARLIPISRTKSDEQIKNMEKIIDQRNTVNDLCQNKFGFKLFKANEKAVLQIIKPCRTENEFTNNIAYLALLIDQLNIDDLKTSGINQEGSINFLQEFLKNTMKDPCMDVISNFRDIMTLRSKKTPFHITDSKFVEVVIRVSNTYPPNWSDLYLRSISLYQESLIKLEECFKLV